MVGKESQGLVRGATPEPVASRLGLDSDAAWEAVLRQAAQSSALCQVAEPASVFAPEKWKEVTQRVGGWLNTSCEARKMRQLWD